MITAYASNKMCACFTSFLLEAANFVEYSIHKSLQNLIL